MKERVYAQVVHTRDELLDRINEAANSIREIPNLLKCVCMSLYQRAEKCLEVQRRHFEHLIK